MVTPESVPGGPNDLTGELNEGAKVGDAPKPVGLPNDGLPPNVPANRMTII